MTNERLFFLVSVQLPFVINPLMKNLMWMTKQNPISPELAYQCETCGKSYQHRATLLRHTRHECGQAPKFKCPYCTHRTKQRGNLYQHIRTNHPGEKVYSAESS
ncbi:hypothetical protein TKK_0011287 [Trichogramma kaykai]